MEKEFRINEPCHVGRENMQDIPGGSFCGFCSKKVHDLTQKTDEEIKVLLQSNDSICGRIQVGRISTPDKKPVISYSLSDIPFSKVAGGIFLSVLLTSNIQAQKTKMDTLRSYDNLDGLIVYAPKPVDEPPYGSKGYYPKSNTTRNLKVKLLNNEKILNQNYFITILTPTKKFSSGYENYINIPSDDIKLKNIFVIEGPKDQNDEWNKNKYFLFVEDRQIKDDSPINLDLNKAKELHSNQKNNDFLYFLDGQKISREEYEENKKKNNILSYFLTEAYAKELFEEYDVENGVIVSYRQ
ncbi:hypothetical protein [Chryseobacterium viscerum]|uniref:Uncharacterized protein n=1 Tax=Chryseobacterium viscerum TaxID=1037377 RepID=A0A5N4BM23_9FLAO|nr:hypothetical protein [Chryseobacterium viscerum]KAB1229135.1 hypothetical protein F8D52_19375 [Chryseobacterium viscerum]